MFDRRYLRKYNSNRHEIWTQALGQQGNFVGGLGQPTNNSRWRTAAILNFWTDFNNSATEWGRIIKFCKNVKRHYPKTPIWRKSSPEVNSRWRRPPFWKHTNCHNSAAFWDIFTKFGLEVDTGSPRLPVTSNFTSDKSKMATAAILKIHLNGHNSVTIAHIRTKFGSVTKTDVPETEIPPHFTSAKIQDGGRPPFWKHKSP